MKVKKAVVSQFDQIIAIVEVEKNVRRVRVCLATALDGAPVNAKSYRVTAAKKVINSRKAEEVQAFCTTKELSCGTFLLII